MSGNNNKKMTLCNMTQRKAAATFDEQGSNYTPNEPTIIESYTGFIGKDDTQLMNQLLAAGIAVRPGVKQITFDILSHYAINCKWYQTDALSEKSSNNMHTTNTILYRPDIKPKHPSKLPLGPNDPKFISVHDDLYKRIVYFLVEKLGMDPNDEKHVRIRAQRFPPGTGIGEHADGDKKIGDLLFSMRLVLGLGASRTINFTLREFDLLEPKANGKRIPGVNFTMTTDDCCSAYLMPPDISGKKRFCFTNTNGTKYALAHHELVKSEKGSDDHAAIFVVDFQLRSEEAVTAACVEVGNNGVSLDEMGKMG